MNSVLLNLAYSVFTLLLVLISAALLTLTNWKIAMGLALFAAVVVIVALFATGSGN